MPNWCSNVLTVTGKPADLLEFKLYAEGHGIFWSGEDEIATDEDREKYFSCMDFSQFVRPTATELDLPYSQHDLEIDGYHWQCQNWGTKWNACSADISQDIGKHEDGIFELIYTFDTAWSPISQKLLDAMTGAFRCLEFVYQFSEGGMTFVGDNSDDGQIQGWTLPETEELRKHVVPIYQEEKPISESDGMEYSEDDMLCDIYCDMIDDFHSGDVWVEGGFFHWRRDHRKEPIILKEG